MDGLKTVWAAVACCSVAVLGCGGDAVAPATTANGNGPASVAEQATAAIDLSSPERAAYAFLEAVRTGDVETSRSLLTPLALKKLEEYQLPFLPQGSDTASFEVYQAVNFQGDRAEVETVWSDLDEQGQPRPEPTRWIMRSVDGKWRVAGMISMVRQNQPIVLDFEHPEELLRQLGVTESQPSAPPATARQAQQQDPFQQTAPR